MRESTANVLHSFTLLLQKLTLWLGSKTQALLAVQESLRRGARGSPRTRGAPEPTGEPGALHRALLTSLPPWALLRLHWNLRGMTLLDTPPGPAHCPPHKSRSLVTSHSHVGRRLRGLLALRNTTMEVECVHGASTHRAPVR